MTTIYLEETSPGAPVLSGTNGTLCNVLDWALTQAGWAIEYTATNARVYRAAVGNRFRLSVRHDSAVSGQAYLALVRGCESATSAVDLVDPFPTVAQSGNTAANWATSDIANTTSRRYRIVVTPTFLLFGVKSLSQDYWEFQMFGDLPKTHPEDAWNTICTSRNTVAGTNFNMGIFNTAVGAVPLVATNIYWVRNIDGSIKSSKGWFNASGWSASAIGVISGLPGARQGYGNRIVREKPTIGCAGGLTSVLGTLINKRGYIPNVWFPVHAHSGGLTSADTFTDTAYAPGSLFIVQPSYPSTWFIIEASNTWSPP